MEYEESGEETKLIQILSYRDSQIQLSAFKRLVRIYRDKSENDAIYIFLETLNTCGIERSSSLLEHLFEFIVGDNIDQDRVEKVAKNKKIVEGLMDAANVPSLQCSSLLILNILFSTHVCKAEWLERIVEIFYCSACKMIERLCIKIIANTIRRDIWPSGQFLEKLRVKIEHMQRCVVRLGDGPETGEQSSHKSEGEDDRGCLNVLREALFNSRPFSIADYLENMKVQNMAEIHRSVDRSFFTERLQAFEEKIEEIVRMYENLLSSGGDQTVQCTLRHIHFLLEVLPSPRLRQVNMKRLKERLIELAEVSNEEIRYLSTSVVGFLMCYDA